jgi:membrane protease YdiL (CAAX protease family)
MARWGWFAAAYGLMAAIAASAALILRQSSPLSLADPWLQLPPANSHVYSLALGLTFGGVVAVATRFLVPRLSWARNLHLELRPLARGLSTTGIVALALSSSLGEELLFRGLLQPWLGLWVQTLLFGLVHQLPGPSRWVWVSWASLVGLVLGAMFQLTGSLAGPLAAHALINALNLSFLRSYDPDVGRRGLGGLLGQRS